MQLVDGLAALPADSATVEAFDWLADEIVEAGGEAWTWKASLTTRAQQEALQQRASAAAATEYMAVTDKARAALADPSRRTLERLRRELRRVEIRDKFGVDEREAAREAVEELARVLAEGGVQTIR